MGLDMTRSSDFTIHGYDSSKFKLIQFPAHNVKKKELPCMTLLMNILFRMLYNAIFYRLKIIRLMTPNVCEFILELAARAQTKTVYHKVVVYCIVLYVDVAGQI